MDNSIKIFRTPYELAEKFADEMVKMINSSSDRKELFTVALSGGSTPELLFTLIGNHFASSVPWKNVHLFWGDERCVTPDNIESNYGMTKRTLIDKIEIPVCNIHRIIGESDPLNEIQRYSDEISAFTRNRNGFPVFDLVILGLGTDGHTASIFPGNADLITSGKICDIAFHPVTNQKRITITGRIINNADSVVFLVTGNNKAPIVEKIIRKSKSAVKFPASYILPSEGSLSWYLDNEAARLLL